MAAKHAASKRNASSVGPGEYSTASAWGGASWTIAAKATDAVARTTPGPGTYDSMHAQHMFPHHSKGPSFDERPKPKPLGDVVAQYIKRPVHVRNGPTAQRFEEFTLPTGHPQSQQSAAHLLKTWNDNRLKAAAARQQAVLASFEFDVPKTRH